MTREIDCESPRIVILLICLSLIGCTASAEDGAAQMRLQQWKESLSSNPRLAVHFRSKCINHVFKSVEERSGAFYRDEKGKAFLRLDECVDRPLSAVEDANSKWTRARPSNDSGQLFLWDESSVEMRSGTYSERALFRPPSALYPANHRTFDGWYRSKASFIALEHFFPSILFPLLFVESPEVGWYDVKLVTTPKSADVCLRLSQSPDATSNHTKSVDAVFRPGEKLPYAVRRFDPSETIEFRFFIDSIRIGEAVEFPDNVLPRTTDHSHDPRD